MKTPLEKAQAEYISFLESESHKTAGFLHAHGWTYPPDGDIKKAETLREEIKRLFPTSPPAKEPQCICGFDSDGWRELIDGVDTIEVGDLRLSYNDAWCELTRESGSIGRVFDESIFVPHKTRRHLPDCPHKPKATRPRDSKAAEDIFPPKEKKPKLDLSHEIEMLMREDISWNVGSYHLASVLQKLQDHANGRGEK